MNYTNFSRREFISSASEIVSCAVLAAGLESCKLGALLYSSGDIPVENGNAEIFISREPALRSVGGTVKKRFASVNNGGVILIVRTADDTFKAFSAQCTHWGAEVGSPVNGIIVCPFHGSRYSADDGDVIEGPAEVSLHQYDVRFDPQLQRLTITLQ